MIGGSPSPVGASLPPWLWFWLVIYAISLPNLVASWQQSLAAIPSPTDLQPEAVGGSTILVWVVPTLASAAELTPSVALFLGVLAIFLPWTRAAYLRRTYRLTDQSPQSPALNEIEEYLGNHAPGIQVRTNLLRTDQLAFVYPLGYRRTAIALFGGLVKLWRSDREAAEAVLLHETAHYRYGDALIVGAGSFFETVIRNLLLLYLLFLFVPQVLQVAAQRITFVQEAVALGVPLIYLVLFTLSQVLLSVVLVFLQSVSLLFWTASIFVLPLLGIWMAEFNADRFAAAAHGSKITVLQALNQLSRPTSYWRWLLMRLSHPPEKLRRWAVRHYGRATGTTLLLLFFPLALLAKLLALTAWALASYLGASFGSQEIGQQMVANVSSAIRTYAPIWLAMAIVILSWPIAKKYWVKLFCSGCAQIGNYGRPDIVPYLLSALAVVALATFGYLLPDAG